MQSILVVEHITKDFGHEKVLKGISFAVSQGEFITILGPSGSGKSTAISVLSGLLRPTSGSVTYKERDITKFSESELADWKREEVGNIFQNYLLLNNLTVRENIMIGVSPSSEPLPFEELVYTLEIQDLLDKFPAQLSGGQQQRVAIARAVIKKPSILFCDEATGALDEVNSKKVVELLHHINSTYAITVLFVTHNLQIAETASRIITIKDGLIFKDTVNADPILANQMVWGEC